MKKIPIECRSIGLSYDGGKTEVLKDISLRIEPGEFFALLGPSGSGKSTLLRLIAGFNRHQRGELLVDGRDISATPPHARNIGMVFQSYALWPHMTVWDNVAFGLVERRMSKAVIKQKVGAALELVGLSQYAQRRPGQLSGGQQQRVALARTIVIEPQVLLLDEPLSNLDKTLRVQMRQELLALQRQLGITTVFVTHDQEEAMTTADRMAVMEGGVVQQVGTPAALFDYPVNAFVAGFVGTTNLVQGEIAAGTGNSLSFRAPALGELALPATSADALPGKATLSFRPHTVKVARVGDACEHRYFWLDGKVEHGEFLGEFVRYHVRVGTMLFAADQLHHASMPGFTTASPIRLGIDVSQIRILAA
ncbi:ABC transporter ATP-binding protein [Noviherbaspirillum humi]|uniref:ABC transporter ATP-binding protein n=1 Tax=Noviherbaspirillum humi TaxID=1688639 RepID=UPI000B78F851|nr:ABC transporter ATP-binding protein [Noviherbaspirillum humi]